ncbi:MAG TPA: HAD family hydrolase, partial [bacterium (Candidatus Stahlbacteria)]|nr:HAD family hydrolase [Candidatus Stahlbacteria bacterium]
PYIFQYALNRLKTYPEKAAFVGDNPFFDVLGARRSGLYSIFIGDHNQYPADIPEADLVITDLASLIDRV